jgi:hypothetical protein
MNAFGHPSNRVTIFDKPQQARTEKHNLPRSTATQVVGICSTQSGRSEWQEKKMKTKPNPSEQSFH